MKTWTLGNASLLWFSLFLALPSFSRAEDVSPDSSLIGPEALLWRLQAERLPAHPLIQAAWRQFDQAQAAADGVDGYFDTVLHLSGGATTWSRPLPGSTLNSGVGENRLALRSGVEQAVLPGLFLGVGLAETYLVEPGALDEDLYQTLAGISAGIPLLKNRGHAQWREQQREAEALREAARQALLAVLQQLRRESDSAWIEWLQAMADAQAFRRAGDRVAKLLEETETLVRLNAVPEYQLYPSMLDDALRKEEIVIADQRVSSARLRLQTLLGDLPALPSPSEALPTWAQQRELAFSISPAEASIEGHGILASLRAETDAARAAEARGRDAAKPDLKLSVSGTWQGESYDSPIGSDALIDDDQLGVAAALVLNVPLQRRSEKAAWRVDAARAAEIEARLQQERNVLRAQLEDAWTRLAATRQRMTLVALAVKNGRLTLAAEADRFRLGEGRSRNVLDAQKDLTAAELRRNAAAAALLRAAAELDFAAAYPGGILPDAPSSPAAQTLIHICFDKEMP